MGKHRKNAHFRRIVVAAVAMGTVGVPSVALACTDWPNGGGQRSDSAASGATQDLLDHKNWWNDASWGRPWNSDQGGAPARTASSDTGTPSASAGPTKAPRSGKSTAKPARTHDGARKAPHTHGGPGKTSAHRPKAAAPWHTVRSTAPRTTATPSPGPRITATATASAAPKPSSTPKAAGTASGVVARLVDLVNAERGKVGCSALTLNTTLSKVAQAHSEDMARHQTMSHDGSDGSSPGDRITGAGYTWSSYGENVAYGYASADQVMAGWMASPGHKANILNCSFKEIGVGLAGPGSYWTQDFGTPR
ncbi:CAP domain-containing protein [Streptomyces sp. NPDC101237]|uniref:CAP domain-containing protein n=1 Tax=Streptomyces sp. NPDC101237 TaxID=3366139 RepID=UPI00382F8520